MQKGGASDGTEHSERRDHPDVLPQGLFCHACAPMML
jgi:hypothetical protein